MEQTPGEHPRAAGIITGELLAALRRDPAFPAGGRTPAWARSIREWPGKVVPANDAQLRAAVLTLISRTLWPHDELRAVGNALAPLYRAGWCNDAVIHLLDRDPDGTRVPPWRLGNGKDHAGGPSLQAYVARRLAAWIPGGDDVPAPPVPGTSFHHWATRMLVVHGDGQHFPPSRPAVPSAPAPVAAARREAPAVRPPRRTLDPGEAAALPVDDTTALLAVPDVHRALVMLGRAGRPHRQHFRQLRAAVRTARLHAPDVTTAPTYADIERLATSITRADGTPIPLTVLRRLIAQL